MPGKKTVYRIWKSGSEYPVADVISSDSEKIQVGTHLTLVNVNNGNERFSVDVDRVEKISVLFWNEGKLERPYLSLS